MRRAALVSLVPLLLAPGLARADDGAPDAAAVHSAIARGVAWLRGQQEPDGGFSCGGPEGTNAELMQAGAAKTGINALAVLALVRAGTSTHDPALRRAVDSLAVRSFQTVYSESLVIQALEAAGVTSPAAKRRAHEASGFLVHTQLPRGAWDYGSPAAAAHLTIPIPPPYTYDNSNTQFALLGLRAAHRLGGDPKHEVWHRAGDHLLADQEADGPEVEPFEVPAAEQPLSTRARTPSTTPGSIARMRVRGWRYMTGALVDGREVPCSVSMTASGVTGLVLVKAHTEHTHWWTQHGPAVDAGIRDGMAWLRAHAHDPLPDWCPYYSLYSIERAAVVCGVEQLGATAWFPLGARRLLEDQAADGSWHGEMGGTTVGTCFALLFLTRATPPAGTTQLRQRTTSAEPAPRPGSGSGSRGR